MWTPWFLLCCVEAQSYSCAHSQLFFSVYSVRTWICPWHSFLFLFVPVLEPNQPYRGGFVLCHISYAGSTSPTILFSVWFWLSVGHERRFVWYLKSRKWKGSFSFSFFLMLWRSVVQWPLTQLSLIYWLILFCQPRHSAPPAPDRSSPSSAPSVWAPPWWKVLPSLAGHS